MSRGLKEADDDNADMTSLCSRSSIIPLTRSSAPSSVSIVSGVAGDSAVAHVLKCSLNRMGEMFDLAVSGESGAALDAVGGAEQLFDLRPRVFAAPLERPIAPPPSDRFYAAG